MAEAENFEDFDLWLANTLKSLEADENVFTSYIRGILEGEDTAEEKKDALESILSDLTENDITQLSDEILSRWKDLSAKRPTNGVAAPEGVDVTLARLMENQAIACTVRSNNYTDEEKRIREAILSQYGQYSDGEEDDTPTPNTGGGVSVAQSSNGLERNTNAALVAQAEREKREQSKVDSQKKKEKDREDREKQKQMQADKKEKRKTQKGERRR